MIENTASYRRDASPLETVTAALDWWREAGVDYGFADEAVSWLERPEALPDATENTPPKPKITLPPPPPSALQRALEPVSVGPPIGGDRGGWPGDLAAFREWWMTEPSLAEGALERRIAPLGVAGARLMVVLPMPLPDDRGTLAEGAPGRFLSAILTACGIAPHEVYLASALPSAAALPDWGDLGARGLGEILAHHVALAAPERVLIFGRSVAGLFGVAPQDARHPFTIAAEGRRLPALAAPELAELARAPARRARFWHNWLAWTL